MEPETLGAVRANGKAGEPDLLIDTSRMSREQREAMEVAESARESAGADGGFAAGLFMGRFERRCLTPFPVPDDDSPGAELARRVGIFLQEHLDADRVDATRTIPAEVMDGLQRLGVFRMKVPAAFGGLGFSQIDYNRVIMAIASYCGSTAVTVSAHQSIGVPQPLRLFGTEQQKERYLPRISAGSLSAFALTEPDVGSDPARMRTAAVLSDDGTHYVLNGEKLWTTNGPNADLLVVMAQTAPKVHRGRPRPQITAFLVETDTPGVEVAHRCDFMGLRGIQNGLIRFTDVPVPAENVLWGEGLGLKLALKTLNTGRLTLPAASVGIGKQCLSIARRWGNERVQWGRPVGAHEAGRDKLSFIAATTYAMEALTWLTSGWADQGREIRIEAAMAKLFCSEACWTVVDRTMQFRGGRGYERAESLRARGETGYPVERMLRDCRINTIIEGTSDIMRLYLAREALDPHLRRAADLLRRGTPLPRRLRAAAGLAGHYAWWGPARAVGRWRPRWPWRGGRLGGHERFIDRTSNRLALALLLAMARNGPKLERRQLLLGRLMEVGTELFAMAAVCAYARQDARPEGESDPRRLADLFCRQARLRIGEHFRGLRRGPDRPINAVGRQVLDGGFRWLEAGAVPVGPEA
jgi:alkylation response protein AidB-like acyl-CoA dehydrogenase